MTAISIASSACAQQGVIDEDTEEWLRIHGLIRNTELELRYPDPATPQAVRALILEGDSSDAALYYLGNFSVPYPDSSVHTIDMIDDLGILIDTLTSYEWITSSAFSSRLSDHARLVRESFVQGDRIMAADVLWQLGSEIDDTVMNPEPGVRVITSEAGRFLWGSIYAILQRLR